MLSLRDARIKIENKKISADVIAALEDEIRRLNKKVRIARFSLVCISYGLAIDDKFEARIALKKMRRDE